MVITLSEVFIIGIAAVVVFYFIWGKKWVKNWEEQNQNRCGPTPG
jgi:hypothetical protein